MADKQISDFTVQAPVAADFFVFQDGSTGLFHAVHPGVASGLAALDANRNVLGAGESFSAAHAGANITWSTFTATDGKIYAWIQRVADNALALYNVTDGYAVLILGPGQTGIKDGNGRLLQEYGTNSNGTYLKFSSGLLICYGSLLAVYQSGTPTQLKATWTFPSGFSAAPSVVPGPYWANGDVPISVLAWFGQQALTSSSCAITVTNMSSGAFSSGDQIHVRPIAIGRWF